MTSKAHANVQFQEEATVASAPQRKGSTRKKASRTENPACTLVAGTSVKPKQRKAATKAPLGAEEWQFPDSKVREGLNGPDPVLMNK